MKALIPIEIIEKKILMIRGEKIMLSMHLAELYAVETRALNQAVKRNIHRFPEDFMFQINESETEQLVSQNVIPHRKFFGGSLPYAFTEQGVRKPRDTSCILRLNKSSQRLFLFLPPPVSPKKAQPPAFLSFISTKILHICSQKSPALAGYLMPKGLP